MDSYDIGHQQLLDIQSRQGAKRKKASNSPKNCHQSETLKESNKIVKDLQKKTNTTNKSYFNLGESPFLATNESSKPEDKADEMFASYDSATGYKEK